MIALLSALAPTLVGLLTSFLPNLLKYFERGQQYKHEMELVRLKMEAAAQGLDHQLVVDSVKAAVQEGESLRTHDMALDGAVWINNLRAAIRPILTITFFAFFIIFKIAVFVIMVMNSAPAEAIVAAIWDVYTNAIFGACIGFWFGTRSMIHTLEQYKKINTK